MADTEQTTTASASSRASTSRSSSNALATDRGTTTIADIVVSKVAGIAAREVGGVHRLGGAVARALSSVTQRLQVDTNSQGVSVSITDSEVTVELTVIIDYGEAIAEVTQEIRDNVIRRIEATTGLTVKAVDISVTDLYFPGDDEPDDA